MTKHEHLLETSYPLPIPLIRDECLRMKKYSKPSLHRDHPTFQTSDYNVGWNVFRWNDIQFNSIEIPYDIQNLFETLYDEMNVRQYKPSPRFYYLPKGSYLPSHKDDGTQCSINFLLSETYNHITIEDSEVYYSQGVLNTQVTHGVSNVSGIEDRLLLKFSIFGSSFSDVCNSIPQRFIL